jgi:hypothetical protein
LLLGCQVTGWAQETGSARQPGIAGERPSRQQTEVWVRQLANRDKRPFDERYVLDPPRNIDSTALADVKTAYDKLSKHFPETLPALIGGLNDRRYAYYQEVPSNGAFVCRDVAHACDEIISAHIEIYHRELTLLDRSGVPRSVHFLSAMGGIKPWYEARKKKSVFELQLEAIDWALEQPRDQRVKQADWNEAGARLRKFRDEFAGSKQPFDPKHRLQFEGK